jgi:site-specific recombinase XerD
MKITMKEIADKCGVSKSYISQVVHGKRPASSKVALELSSAGISVKQIESKLGLQIRWGALKAFGGFDSHTLPPDSKRRSGQHFAQVSNDGNLLTTLLTTFIKSRRQGLSPRTLEFYRTYLKLSKPVLGAEITGQQISRYIESLKCSNGGRHAYYRALRAFYNWLYSRKSGFNLNAQDNPILYVDPPKVERKILPSLTIEQVSALIKQAGSLRDKAIISLLTDSGLRLSELANIKVNDIDWKHRLIKVRCKGNKEGLATYGTKTEAFLKRWLSEYNPNDGNIWGTNKWGIIEMLKQLRTKTGLPCKPHTFRRTFACLLRKAGVDTMTIKDLGRWESLEIVQRYPRMVSFAV